MKSRKCLFLLIFIIPFASIAAFSESENKQLSDINEKYKSQVDATLSLLHKAVYEQIANNPEKKVMINSLYMAWDVMIHKNACLKHLILLGQMLRQL